jgi:LPXTG-site transpeptidase (sortase) family protein
MRNTSVAKLVGLLMALLGAIMIAIGTYTIYNPTDTANTVGIVDSTDIIDTVLIPDFDETIVATSEIMNDVGALLLQPAAPPTQPQATATAIAVANAQYVAATETASQFPIPDRLWIDALKIDAKIQAVGPGKRVGKGNVEWSAPNNKNIGWHDYSGRFGQGKNIVLNGHNNIFGSVFRKLYTLKEGDEIRLGAGEQVTNYKVEKVLILKERGQPMSVRIENAQYIQPSTEDRLTLVSCYPETSNTHRVIVLAKPVK